MYKIFLHFIPVSSYATSNNTRRKKRMTDAFFLLYNLMFIMNVFNKFHATAKIFNSFQNKLKPQKVHGALQRRKKNTGQDFHLP